jgi:hypothetical protein
MMCMDIRVGIVVKHDIVIYLYIIWYTLFIYDILSVILNSMNMKCSKEFYNKN